MGPQNSFISCKEARSGAARLHNLGQNAGAQSVEGRADAKVMLAKKRVQTHIEVARSMTALAAKLEGAALMCGQSDAMRTLRGAAGHLSEACGLKGLLSDRCPAHALIPNGKIEKLLKRLDQID